MNDKILAGIVCYNPDVKRLLDNIEHIINQVNKLIIIDNGSKNIDIIKKSIPKNVVLIENKENEGIANALNQIHYFAIENEYQWFLTIDQDSVLDRELVRNYKKYLSYKSVGIICCEYIDRNTYMDRGIMKLSNNVKYVNECITSGSLCNTEVISNIGSFDNKLFIDLVDMDICRKIIDSGYRIIKIPYYGFMHELGKSQTKNIFNKKINIYNGNIKRLYYISRNSVYMAVQYHDIYYLRTLVRHIIKSLLFEKNRLKRLKAYFLGFYDAMKGNMGKCVRKL